MLLSGVRIKQELVLQTAEEGYRIEFPPALLGDLLHTPCFLVLHPEFLIQSDRLTLSYVTAEQHKPVLRAGRGIRAGWRSSSLQTIS